MYRCIIELNTAQFPPISRTSLPIFFYKILIFMAMRDRERGTVFWSFGYPENIDQTHQTENTPVPGAKSNNQNMLQTCCSARRGTDEERIRHKTYRFLYI